ncbi:hypothetical protein Pfo_031551 [Paulownia fortunei]|nr:hypothetical protein Pfo_031551 [Paulownia fortunei]
MGVLGNMYAYSGANTMYRKDAVLDCGGFRQDRATEDISIAWDQQFSGWKAVFAPDIMFYMNVPSTLGMLYNQENVGQRVAQKHVVTNFSRIFKHPIKNIAKIVLLLDQTEEKLYIIMKIITKISVQKQAGRYNIDLDNQFAFGVSESVLIKYGLAKGRELDDDLIADIKLSDEVAKAMRVALNYLGHSLRVSDINIEEALATYTDEEQIIVATQLAKKAAVTYKRESTRSKRQKIIAALATKGFSFDMAQNAVSHLAAEHDDQSELENIQTRS